MFSSKLVPMVTGDIQGNHKMKFDSGLVKKHNKSCSPAHKFIRNVKLQQSAAVKLHEKQCRLYFTVELFNLYFLYITEQYYVPLAHVITLKLYRNKGVAFLLMYPVYPFSK